LCLPTFVEKPVASSLSISVKVLLINVWLITFRMNLLPPSSM
jgi:hypothetical protein